MAKSETKSRKLSAYATATVRFKCTAGPSIIFIDRIWALIKKGCRPLAYIANVMRHLNKLRLLFQYQQTNVIGTCKKLKTFKLKLSLWSHGIENKNFANFPSLDQIANNFLQQNVKNDIISHLTKLAKF